MLRSSNRGAPLGARPIAPPGRYAHVSAEAPPHWKARGRVLIQLGPLRLQRSARWPASLTADTERWRVEHGAMRCTTAPAAIVCAIELPGTARTFVIDASRESTRATRDQLAAYQPRLTGPSIFVTPGPRPRTDSRGVTQAMILRLQSRGSVDCRERASRLGTRRIT